MKMTLVKIVLVYFIFQANVFAKDIPFTAYVNKTTISEGETLRLTLEFIGQVQEQPDLSPLKKDFTIESTQERSESRFINGNFSRKQSWTLELLPKTTATSLTIPPIKLGHYETRPIIINQSQQPVSQNQANGVSLTVTTDRNSVYKNGELILTIKVKTDRNLVQGSLSELDLPQAIVEPIFLNEKSEVVEHGIKYFIFTKTYAIFPSHVGTLTIPSLVFKGRIDSHNTRTDPWSSFYPEIKNVVARSLSLSIEVKDVPPSYPKDQPFLPLKDLVVIESFELPNATFEVNRTTTRRFEIKARGILPSFVPGIKKPMLDGIQVYEDAEKREKKNTEDGIVSSLNISHSYVPYLPGEKTIPEETIYWWDVNKEELKTTKIRELKVNIGGEKPTSNNATTDEKVLPEVKNTASSGSLYLVCIIIFLIFAVILSVIFINIRRKNRLEKSIVADLISACNRGDSTAAYQQLLLLQFKNPQIYNVMRPLAEKLGALYVEKNTDQSFLLKQIKDIIKTLSRKKKNKDVLHRLYPE